MRKIRVFIGYYIFRTELKTHNIRVDGDKHEGVIKHDGIFVKAQLHDR